MDFITIVFLIIIFVLWFLKKHPNNKGKKIPPTFKDDGNIEYRDLSVFDTTPKKWGTRDALFWGVINNGCCINRKNYFLTRCEREFYERLSEWYGDYCYIHCQVSLGQLTTIPKGTLSDEEHRRFSAIVNNMALDYVFVSKKTNKVVCVIELDDATHQRENRIERDKKLNKILSLAKIGFLRVPVGNIDNKPDIWKERDSIH
ncbi:MULTISPECIES: DUF2726 domain-containing protein [Pectobacterium]|uniref:DUF2726 domain-containing protein n=1 Tax=Pectobacterium TaxID=122277 RepID=UPI0015E000DC|nr:MULTISPECIES: DUF2726 domain-containing protein [Pectobacterium]MBA0190423.1 DUF2726 domain-containing protein [Pectobacterium odoriferum]GKV90459.1 hypothetical protein PEC301619_24410 [Pectobacterium carotovorum subsp. carotovorum]